MTLPEPSDNPPPFTEVPSFAEVLVSRLRVDFHPELSRLG
jgi:hypothetical protein